jgi:outer membrane autotransporter protein
MNDGFLAALTMHNRYAAWHAIQNHLISYERHAHRTGYRGQADSDMHNLFCTDVCCRDAGNRDIWVNYIGRNDVYRSGFNDQNWELSSEGVQAGADLFRNKRGQLGLLIGAEWEGTHNAADRVKAQDIYFSFYGVHILRCGVDVRGSFAWGWQDYDMKRVDNFDEKVYTSSFKGNTSEINLELGRRVALGAWSLRPVAALDVYTNDLNATKEIGEGLFWVKYDKINLTQVFARSGAELRYQIHRWTLNSGVYYARNLNDRELHARVSDDYLSGLLKGSLGRELLTLNVGSSCQIDKNFAVFGGYDGQYTLDGGSKSMMHAGYMGGGFRW